jgi:hypothetical protein
LRNETYLVEKGIELFGGYAQFNEYPVAPPGDERRLSKLL